MFKITGKQCKKARSLLKWNLQDLASRLASGIQTSRIDSFEKGFVHVMQWENDELSKAFKAAGIEFSSDLEVYLRTQTHVGTGSTVAQELGPQLALDVDDLLLTDKSAEDASAAENAEHAALSAEEEKRKK